LGRQRTKNEGVLQALLEYIQRRKQLRRSSAKGMALTSQAFPTRDITSASN